MGNYVRNDSLYGSGSVGPGELPDNAYDRVGTPNTCSFTKTPNAVIFGDVADDVGFFFGGRTAFNGLSVNSSSVHYQNLGTPAAGTVLNIHPTAWSGSSADATAGRITFVYSSGLRTGPR